MVERPEGRPGVETPDPDEGSAAAQAVAPEILANSLSEYVRAWIARVRAGDSGVLPVIVSLIVICVIFQVANPNFLTPGNLVNLMVQGAVFMLLAMGEVFALLLGE